MVRAFIDTCVWFDIAEDSKRLPELRMIEELVRRGAVELIVPRLALNEFHKKRDNIVQATETSLFPHLQKVREAAVAIGGPRKRLGEFLAYLDEIASHGPIDGGSTSQALERIERLLVASPVVEESDDVQRAAIQRGVNKLAPLHQRSSVADAILLETYVKCTRESADRFIFVTHNKSDFSFAQNHKEPHPHLAAIFLDDSSRYFIDLLEALTFVDARIVAEVQARNQPTVRSLVEQLLKSGELLDERGTMRTVLNRISREADFATKPLAKLKPNDFVEYARLRRKGGVKASTVMTYFRYLKVALLWGHRRGEDVSVEALDRARRTAEQLGLIGKSAKPPVKRLSLEDERKLVQALEELNQHPLTEINALALMQFSLWTGRRLGEICSLRWEDFHRDSRICAIRKNGKKKRFPLLGRALEIVLQQHAVTGNGDRIFPYNPKSASQAFDKRVKQLGVDFSFEQLRDEGLRRLLEGHEYSRELIRQLHPKRVDEIQAQLDEGRGL
jgi:integrase